MQATPDLPTGYPRKKKGPVNLLNNLVLNKIGKRLDLFVAPKFDPHITIPKVGGTFSVHHRTKGYDAFKKPSRDHGDSVSLLGWVLMLYLLNIPAKSD